MNRGRVAGLAAITVTSLLWGTTGTAATFAPEVGPLAIGAAALGIGGLLQALIAIGSLRESRSVLGRHRRFVLVGGLAVAVYPLAFYSSMDLAGVAIGSVASLASAPLASGMLERIVDRRPLSRWWASAAGMGIAGSALLVLPATGSGPGGGWSTLLGIGLGLVAGTTYATFSWASHRLIGRGIPRAASMGAVFGLGGLLLMPVLLLTGGPLLASPQNLTVAAYMALVPMFLGYVLFGYGLTQVPASTATTVTLTEPAVAAVLAVLVVGEQLTGPGWLGLAIIAAVLPILALAPTNAAEPSAATARPPAGTAADPRP